MGRADEFGLEQVLERCASRAVSRGVPHDIVRTAREATRRRIGRTTGETLSARDETRAEAYFTAVVRRRCVRRDQPARSAAHFVVAAVVADLKASGRDGRAIWEELDRGWHDAVPPDILQEYRLRLCG